MTDTMERIEGSSDCSRPHKYHVQHRHIEVEDSILDLRLSKRFRCNDRIKSRLRKSVGVYCAAE